MPTLVQLHLHRSRYPPACRTLMFPKESRIILPRLQLYQMKSYAACTT